MKSREEETPLRGRKGPAWNVNRLEEPFDFYRLLAQTSTLFINLPSDQIDSVIEDTQRRVCEFFGLEMSVLWQVSIEDPRFMILTHVYRPLGGPAVPERMEAQQYFPWSLEQVSAGRIIALTVEHAPTEAATDVEYWRHYGVKSALAFPLSTGESPVFGVLNFNTVRKERSWPDTLVGQLQLLAQIFANALARKRADLELRESEARLNLATNAAGAGLWIMEVKSAEVWVSAKTRELFHFAPDQKVTYGDFFKVIHPADHEQVRQAVKQTLQSGENLRSDYRILLPDGSIRWIGARGQRYPSTEPVRLMGVSLDITERKQAEQALKERLAFEGLLADLSGRLTTISSVSLDMEIRNALNKILEFFQADRIGLVTLSGDRTSWQISYASFAEGMPPLPLQTDLPRSLFPWILGKIVDRQEVVSISAIGELPREAHVDKESLRKWGIRSSLNIPVASGGAVGCVSITADRKERDWPEEYVPRLRAMGNTLFNAMARTEMEERIRTAAEEWQATFDSIPDIVMILDRDLRILRHNTAAVSFFNLPSEEILGRHCHHLMHGANEPPLDCPATKSLSIRGHHEREIYDTKRKAWFSISAVPIIDKEGQVKQIVHRIKDITERLEAEEKARQQWEQLAHVTRVTMMGELTTSLAHEINQPLTAIQSNAEAAQRFMSQAVPDTGEVHLILEDIIRDSSRASDMIQRIRALLKKAPIPFAPLDVNDETKDILRLVRVDSLLPELAIRTRFSPDLPLIAGDRIQIQQVILNLIVNGAAAMKDTPPAQRTLMIKTEMRQGRAVKVSVTDFGTGIDAHDIECLFEPFYTTKPGGLGMGLSISQTIIKAHGGTMEASNNPEGGATFAFTLPAHQEDPS